MPQCDCQFFYYVISCNCQMKDEAVGGWTSNIEPALIKYVDSNAFINRVVWQCGK